MCAQQMAVYVEKSQ